jgi:hypothetical protein
MKESEAVQEIINKKSVSENTYADLILLIKYYYSQAKKNNKRLKMKEVISELQEYLKPQYDNYQSVDWYNRLEKLIKKYKNTPLYDVDSIPITDSELTTIKSIKNKKLEKIAFVSLVLAKYYNLKNEKNNGYVNVEYSVIFGLARVSATIMYEQPLLLHELKEMNLVQRSNRIDNPNFRVLFIDDDSPVVLHITDLRELGYQYLKYKGEKFIECAECGVLLRKKNNATKYCPSCRGYQPIQFKTLTCVDCGKEFVVNSKSNKSCRCEDCYKEYRRIKIRENVRNHRIKNNM